MYELSLRDPAGTKPLELLSTSHPASNPCHGNRRQSLCRTDCSTPAAITSTIHHCWRLNPDCLPGELICETHLCCVLVVHKMNVLDLMNLQRIPTSKYFTI